MAKEGNNKRVIEIALIISIMVFFLLLMYFVIYKDIFLIFTQECEDENCFKRHLSECKRASFLDDAKDATKIYTIKGKSKNTCEVEVLLANVKEGKADLRKLEGKEMTCYLPIYAIAEPGNDLELCTGKLKEDMQDLIIKKMHSYLLENIGQINEEITKAV